MVNVVRVGEVGGMLESSMARLSEILEGKLKMRNRLLGASLYPLVVLGVMVLVISIVLTVAVPQFAAIFRQTGGDEMMDQVPALTIFMFAISDLLVAAWPALLLAVVADLLLQGLERLLTPWMRSKAAA